MEYSPNYFYRHGVSFGFLFLSLVHLILLSIPSGVELGTSATSQLVVQRKKSHFGQIKPALP